MIKKLFTLMVAVWVSCTLSATSVDHQLATLVRSMPLSASSQPRPHRARSIYLQHTKSGVVITITSEHLLIRTLT